MNPILPTSGRVVVYVVGLEKYGKAGGVAPVEYARQDAEAFIEALGMIFPDRETDKILLLDSDATHSHLNYDLPQRIAGLNKDDLFVFYFAGHGFFGDGGNRLTAFDSNLANLTGTTWLLRQLLTDPLEQSHCQRALIFIDACAEKLDVPGRSLTRPMDESELKALGEAKFHAVFMSCERGQKSYPSDRLKHGVWTYFLLKALRGEADDALGPGRVLTGNGLHRYLRREVSAFVAKENPGRIQQPYALIGSSGNFVIGEVPVIIEPSTKSKQEMHPKDLIAIGPDIVAVGEILGSEGNRWTIELESFVVGDRSILSKFVDDFEGRKSRDRYVLVNEMGEGRTIASPPSWQKTGTGKIHFQCSVAPPAERISVHRLPSRMAEHAVTRDIYAENGAIARVSGMASFTQTLQTTMSLVRGEAFQALDEGAVFSDYFAKFRESPWLPRLFMLEVIRLSSISREVSPSNVEKTPLSCVDRVLNIELLDRVPQDRRVRVKLELDVRDTTIWTGEVSVLILDEESLQEIRARTGLMRAHFQPTVDRGTVEPIPVSLPIASRRKIR